MPDRLPKYARSGEGDRLWQGEILSALVQVRQRLDTIGSSEPPILDEITHPFAIVLSQDCDLLSDFNRRKLDGASGATIPNVVLCQATTAESLKGNVTQGKDIWKRIVQNKDERYHCLEAVSQELDAASTGIGALGIDFKLFFTIPTDELYRRMERKDVRRRCRLTSPYAEHLAVRFFHFQARIPLPEDHEVSLQPLPPGI